MKKELNNKRVTVNKKQSLFVIPCGNNGYSCYGFDVVLRKSLALATEMNVPYTVFSRGSLKSYNEYLRLTEIANEKNRATGWRSQSELYKPFIGHEGKRVQVTNNDGSKERFIIGKSTGFIPCHIMRKQSNSNGGCAVLPSLIQSFYFV